jgi:hypothetical protein
LGAARLVRSEGSGSARNFGILVRPFSQLWNRWWTRGLTHDSKNGSMSIDPEGRLRVRLRTEDHWPRIADELSRVVDLEASARAAGAFQRAREVRDPETLLRLVLAYGSGGMSLRDVSGWAEEQRIASLSSPALFKRLCNAEGWLGGIVAALLEKRIKLRNYRLYGHRLCAIDATTLCEPGADRTTWRVHVAYDVASGGVDQLELTDVHGGESLKRFTFRPGDIVLADRGYARPRDLRPVIEAGANLIVRTGWNSLRLLTAQGAVFDLFAKLRTMKTAYADAKVYLDEGVPEVEPLALRLVIRRKTKEQARKAQQELVKDARKRGREPDPKSLEAARFLLLLTSLPAGELTAATVANLYRLRWQIELAFKRYKSLAGLDELTAKTPRLARSWIHAKLILALLAERIAGLAPDSPPCALRTTETHALAVASHEGHPQASHPRNSRPSALDHEIDPDYAGAHSLRAAASP